MDKSIFSDITKPKYQQIYEYLRPVITPEEAEEMLLAGRYFTTVPEDPPTAETVRGVTLVYRNFLSETSFLPYYRFLVELPNETIGDMLAFGAYYVPAVEEQFISNLP